ncbi:hypothetical protein DM02DRAFT_721089 [Periconia macrospinosa]|uniref:Zn(2)-C6 fungal-type domain-containing protein n=1 Tax=Periconia macrospinosa TaxID=97972 RepID=A0A2V1D9L1_9PLEO|nr:hypothetical protein DM02DRAFT_721089 [Periconia macrospinosa]
MDPRRPLRPLLPAFAGIQQAPSPSSKDKRKRALTACEACRSSKSKCSAERPSCRKCVASGLDCKYAMTESKVARKKYAALKARMSAYDELYELLMDMPEPEAQQVFSRIRTGVKAEDIVSQVKDGNLLLQLSLVPEARRRYEFPYLNEIPAYLLQSSSPYIDTIVFEYNLKEETSRKDLDSRVVSHGDRSHDVFWKPYHAAVIAEPKLDLIKPSKWTSVSSDDNFMRKLLGTFFLSEYFSKPFFHKDYFLEDMAQGKTEHCSALLVNAILAGACNNDHTNPNRAEFWNPRNLGYRFLAEARRLYELELSNPKLTTVQASPILHSVYNMHGTDIIGHLYTKRAIEMAHRLGLFKTSPELSEKEQNARSFTAWSLYGWQGIVSYFAQLPPLITTPPETSLPDPVEYAQRYGEIWFEFPSAPTLFSTQFGHLYKAKTELYMIALDIATIVRPDENTHVKLTVEQTLLHYAKLMSWNKHLPSELKPDKIVTPSQIQQHMLYKNLIINILEEPMATELSSPEHTQLVAQVFDKSPHETLRDAKISFEILIRLYYLRHGFESLDGWMMQYLSFLAFMAHGSIKPDMQESQVKTLHSTLVLAARGIRDQSHCHYAGQMVFSAVRGVMRAEEVELIDKFTAQRGRKETHPPHDWESQSMWCLDLGKSVSDDREEANLSKLFSETKIATWGNEEQSEKE